MHLGAAAGVGLEGALAHCRLRRNCEPTVGPIVRWSALVRNLRFVRPSGGRPLPEGTVVVQAAVNEGGSQLRYGPSVDRVKPGNTAQITRQNPSSKSGPACRASRHAAERRDFWILACPGPAPVVSVCLFQLGLASGGQLAHPHPQPVDNYVDERRSMSVGDRFSPIFGRPSVREDTPL